MRPTIAITVGDHNGIGPEIALKSLSSAQVRRVCEPILVGPVGVFQFYARQLGLRLGFQRVDDFEGFPDGLAALRGQCRVYEPRSTLPVAIRPGRLSADAGRIAGLAIEQAVAMTRSGRTRAMVTAPVSKRALHLAGIPFPGQTEMVQTLSGSPHVAMMLVSRTLRVGLVTIHIPLREVADLLTRELVCERIRVIQSALRRDWGIRRPRLAVLGLNPHAGESGDLGSEEERVVLPALEELRKQGIRLYGPFPADAFFGRYQPGIYDAVVAMYHDQGLIPLKMSAAGKGVNVSAGLVIIRTSPDHGTAFDIAGKRRADPGSMIEAIVLAAQLARNRGPRPVRLS